MELAMDQVDAWLESPGATLLSEGDGYWAALRHAIATGLTVGPQIHDARIAALCRHHGIDVLCTADRDFGRFPELSVRNPLVR